MIEEEGGDARLGLAVDDGPVDGSRAAVLGQQGGMEVEGAHGRHRPYHLGQHTEGHNDLEVSPVAAQLFEESLVLQALGLQDGDVVLQGEQLDGRRLQGVVMTAHRLIGHRDDCHNIILVLHQFTKGLHGKLGSAHEDDAHRGLAGPSCGRGSGMILTGCIHLKYDSI